MDNLLQSYVVGTTEDDTPATRLVTVPDLGRVVVVSKEFPVVGEVLLRERPLLVWDNEHDAFRHYLEAFLESSPEAKSLVLDMHTPGPDTAFMQRLRPTAESLCGRFTTIRALGVDQVTKLIGAANINAHEYYGRRAEAFHEVVSNERHISSGRSALFAYGSKIAHSCCPNVTYSSKTSDGCLEYKLIASIKEGEVVSFPYIDATPSNPTHIRRQQLLKEKYFFCGCERCTGFDYARTHCCHTKDCSGHISCVQVKQEDEQVWSCSKCGPIDVETVQELLRTERYIEDKLNVMMAAMMLPGGVSNVHPSKALELATEACHCLSFAHFLALKCMAEASRTCASHAAGAAPFVQMGMLTADSPTPFGTFNDLRLQSAFAGMVFVRGCECIEAKCLQSFECVKTNQRQHPPVYACTASAFHVFQDLKDVPRGKWDEESVAFLSRYVPMCYLQFGQDDADTAEMEAALMATTTHSSAVVAPTRQERAARKGNGGGGTSKKKKGKKGRKKK